MMKTRIGILCVLAAGAYLAYPQEKSDVPGAATARKMCGTCHAVDTAFNARRTMQEWDEVISSMVAKGLQASDTDLDTVFAYLVKAYGRVNVNTAPGDEIAAVLGLPGEQGDAIVSYRGDHGQFADFDALAKVPGVDVKQLEKSRPAISF